MKQLLLLSFLIVSTNSARAQDNIILDGKLEEEVWRTATTYSDFKLIEPRLEGTPSQRVKTFINYTEKHLLVGVQCSYDDINSLYANSLERDLPLLADDYIEFQIDSYNDRNSCLIFRTNALGARYDAEMSNNGDNINSSWDAIWDVATHKTDSGWSAEFKIPLYSLRFNSGEVNKMRFKIVVYYKNLNEKLVYPLKNSKVVPLLYHFENFEELTFHNLQAPKPLFITPYLKADAAFNKTRDTSNTRFVQQSQLMSRKFYSKNESLDKVISNIGVDLKLRLKNSNLDLTLNTDFAQAEGDDRLINVTRFPINTPEKRLFFLENNELFSSEMFAHRLFNSRQVGIDKGLSVPIIAGMRFTGAMKNNQYGIMSVLTKELQEKNLEGYSLSVARWRRILDSKASNIGIIMTSKLSTTSNYYNYMSGIDGIWRWKNNYRIQYMVASTFDQAKGNFKPAYGLGLFTFRPNGFGVDYRYWEYTKDFTPGIGFISEPDAKRLTLNTGFRRTYNNKQKKISYLSFGHYVRQSWQSSDDKRGFFQTNIYLTTILRSGIQFTGFIPMFIMDQIYTPWKFSENVTIAARQYKMWKVNPIFSSGNAFRFNATLDLQVGQFYGGSQKTAEFVSGYDVARNFRMELGGSWNIFTFPDSFYTVKKDKEVIGRIYSRLKLSLSSKSFLNLYTQYDNVQQKIVWNLRYRYMPREGTNLYIVLNTITNTVLDQISHSKPRFENELIIIKFSKTFAVLSRK
jgi:hypothetical protein